MNILQFENTELQQLHAKAATVANGEVVEGPFVGKWWEHYLAVVIETAQAEQRVACSKDVAEIRDFYDLMARDLDKANAAVAREVELRGLAELERNDLRNALILSTTRENEGAATIAELRDEVSRAKLAAMYGMNVERLEAVTSKPDDTTAPAEPPYNPFKSE